MSRNDGPYLVFICVFVHKEHKVAQRPVFNNAAYQNDA